MITFIDPRAEIGTPAEAYELSIDVTAAPTTIGLVANGFPDSEEFLNEVEKALAVVTPGASFARWNKRNASSTISDDMLDEVLAACDAVVAAYGH